MKINQLFKKFFSKFFNKEKPDYKEHEEIRRSIAVNIQDIRVKHLTRELTLPHDQQALDEFYKLAIYCINNFPLPLSHISYFNNRLKINASDTKDSIINMLFSQWSQTKLNFDFEFPLRGIEVIFSYGKFKITEDQAEMINHYINNLRIGLDNQLYKVS